MGDLIVKEYWDGENYDSTYDPAWDVETIRIYDSTSSFYCIYAETYEVKYFQGATATDVMTLTQDQYSDLIDLIWSHYQAGDLNGYATVFDAGVEGASILLNYETTIRGCDQITLDDPGNTLVEEIAATIDLDI